MTLIMPAPAISAPVASAFWRRVDLPGHDTARVEKIDGVGWCLTGMTVFRHPQGPASLTYVVDCDPGWEILSAAVYGMIGARNVEFHVNRYEEMWMLNEMPVPGLDHLCDFDLGFTPASYLMMFKRVGLGLNETMTLPVVRLDIEAGTLSEAPQVFTRIGATAFWHESPQTGYAAQIDLAPDGFVMNCPGLCEAEIAL